MIWIVRQNATGNLYQIKAKTEEEVYKVFGRRVLGLTGDFDTGNVDIDVCPLDPKSEAKRLF